MPINEIENLLNEYGNIKVRAYYKIVNGLKFYYDYQSIDDDTLNGSYQELHCLEFLYYLKEQSLVL